MPTAAPPPEYRIPLLLLFTHASAPCPRPPPLQLPLPPLLAVGAEQTRGVAWNAGVIVMNAPALKREVPAMVRYGERRGFNFTLSLHDQGEPTP